MNRGTPQRHVHVGTSNFPARFFETYAHQLLAGIIFLALVLRIAAIFSFKNTVYFDFLLWDERLYHIWAKKIAEGAYHALAVYEFAPLPAYLMAFIYKIFSVNTLYIRAANIVFGVLTCYLVYLIGTEMGGRTVGLCAALLAAICKPFIFYSIVLLKTSLSVFLFASTVYLLLAVLKRRNAMVALLLGVSIGAMVNVRPQGGVLVPFVPLAMLWYAHKTAGLGKALGTNLVLYIVGFSLAIGPFVIRNYGVAGKLALTASQSGFNFYLGNNPNNPDPYYLPVPFASSSPFEQGIQFTIEASRRLGKRLSPQQASSYWRHQVIQNARQQPGRFAEKATQKILAAFQPFQPGDHFDIGFISQFASFFRLPFPGFFILFPFGAAGLLTGLVRSRRILVLNGIVLLYVLTLVVFFTNTRYRLPLMALLLPAAVLGIRDVCHFFKHREVKKILLYIAVASAVMAIECLPVRGKGDMTAYYNTHAIALSKKGLDKEAAAYWQASSDMNGRYSAFANLSLAGRYVRHNDWQSAKSYLDKIDDQSFAAAHKYAVFGDMMVKRHQIDQAITAYEKSLSINAGQRRTRLKLAKLYERIDQKRASEEYAKLQYIASFYNVF